MQKDLMLKFNLHEIFDSLVKFKLHKILGSLIIALTFFALSLAFTYWSDYKLNPRFTFISIAVFAFFALELTLDVWFGRKDKNHTMIYFVLVYMYSSLLIPIGLILQTPWLFISIVSFAFLSLTFAIWFYEKTKKVTAIIYFVLAYVCIVAAINFISETPWLLFSIVIFALLSFVYWLKKRAKYAPMLSYLLLAGSYAASFMEMEDVSCVLLMLTNVGIVLYLFIAAVMNQRAQQAKRKNNPLLRLSELEWPILLFAWFISLVSFRACPFPPPLF